MSAVHIKGYKRKGPKKNKIVLVKPYNRKSRPMGKKKIIGKVPIKMYSVRDENGHFKGWSYKR